MSLETPGAAPAAVAAPAVAPAAVQPGNPNAPVNVYVQAPATPANPAAPLAPAPVAAPTAPAGPQMVPIPLEQLQAFAAIQARLADMEAAQRSQQEAAQREHANLLLAKGQAEEALRLERERADQQLQAERTQVAEIRRQSSNYAIDVEVARAMAPHQFFNDEARRDFEGKVRSELIAEPQGNTFAVRTAQFQSAEQVVAAKIATGNYNYMLAPRGVSGTQTGQTIQTGPAPAANPAPVEPTRPQNAGQAIIDHYKEQLAKIQANPSAGYMPNRTIGLGPVASSHV